MPLYNPAAAGSGVLAVQSKTAAYTALTTDGTIKCDSSGGTFSITLYAASGNAGRSLTIIKTDSSFTAVTVDGNASETINGATTTTLNTQWESLELLCDGTNWVITERKTTTGLVAYTPTGTWVTNTTYTGFWERCADVIRLHIQVACTGAPTAASLRVDLPSGLTIDTAKMLGTLSANTHIPFGTCSILDGGTLVYTAGHVTYLDTNTIHPYYDGGTGSAFDITATAPITFGNTDKVWIYAELPISGWNP